MISLQGLRYCLGQPSNVSSPAVMSCLAVSLLLAGCGGGGGGSSTPTNTVDVTDTVDVVDVAVVPDNPVVQPSPTGKLNDTGVIQCGNATSNGVCPQAGFPMQDAENGRDANQATNNDADGHRGFSFTKISSTGMALPADAMEWSCVKDNVTGLIWEVKTNDDGLHDKDWTYTWYDTNTATNGGSNGIAAGGSCGGTSQCDTHSFVTAVNTAGWCGARSGWRLPTVGELQSIVDLSHNTGMVDTAYFPNTSGSYWCGIPHWSESSWSVSFVNGAAASYFRGLDLRVQLVRSGQ